MEGNIGGHLDLDIEITGFTRDRPAGEIVPFIRHLVCQRKFIGKRSISGSLKISEVEV